VARLLPCLTRALVWALPFTAGPALNDALHPLGHAARTVASVGLWAGWAVGVAASLVPHPISLTAWRTVAPAAFVAGIAAAVSGEPSASAAALAVAWTGVTLAWVAAPATAERCVNGPAYPNERRHLLRAPGPLLVGPLAIAWALGVAGAGAGPLLLASRHWVLGAATLVVGLPVAAVLLRSLHALARRWLVFVPAGVVLHDHMTLMDTLLVPRADLRSIGPARSPTTALDLTQRAPGLVLELALRAPADLTLVRPGRRDGERRQADRLLVTPTRPGAVLAEARTRRYPIA